MEDLIKNLTSQLNIDEGQATGGLGLLLKLAQDKLDLGDFSKITSIVGSDNINTLLSKAPNPESSGGLMGALGGLASSLGASKLGSLATLSAGFKQLNMGSDTLSSFGRIVVAHLKNEGGDDVKAAIKKFLG